MKRLFIVLNSEKFLISHRLLIAQTAQQQGFDVCIVAPDTGYVDEIYVAGFKFIEIKFNRSGLNVLKELNCLYSLWKLYKTEKPDIIHHVTIKVCLIGSLAAKLSGIKSVVNAISGFGYAFSGNSSFILKNLIGVLIKICFKSNTFRFIVQNPDDFEQLESFKVAEKRQIALIKGSGVDLNEFRYTDPNEEDFNCLFPSRMLYEKGVLDFIEAAKLLREKLNGKVRFLLVGNCDEGNKSVISRSEIEDLSEPPYIEYLGFRTDMLHLLKECNIVVLPSYYREGLPKALIEACAIGRPIITTNLPGCKECLRNDNGFFVSPKSPADVADKVLTLFNEKKLRISMGKKSRELAERDFDVRNVAARHLQIYKELSN
ncbi:glycosyl transferase family 1 [Bacteroidia bacterium]|nr:glycosyl transferase family 1 [Bacteroidia bacterium]